jgi:uncharacterized protein YpiB (UPF0302 family)
MKSEHSREQSMNAMPSSFDSGEKLVSLDKELAQIMTDEIVVKARITQLEGLIDQSLANRNKALFMTLTEEYLRLTR